MKSNSNILVLVAMLAAIIAFNVQAQKANPPYLAQFPSVEQIRADVRGIDAMETAAKQAGIFWQLHELLSLLAYSQRRTERQFTPDEQRLEPEYRNAYYAAVAPFEGKVTGSDKTRWFELHTKYEMDLWLRDEVFKKYFTADLRRSIYVALKGEMPIKNAPEESRLTPSATAIAAAARPSSTTNLTSQPNSSAGGNADDYLAQGFKFHEAKDYARAIAAFKKAIALEPSWAAYYGLGSAYSHLKQYSDAAAALQQAIRLKPNDARLHSLLGFTYDDMMQYEKAIASFREAQRLGPDDPNNSNNLGNVYSRLEQYPEPVTAYQQAIRLAPNDADFLQNLGETYIDMGRKEEALRVYQALQKIDPVKAKSLYSEIQQLDAGPDVLISVGTDMLNAKRYGDALKFYRRAIALKPDASTLPIAHGQKGLAYLGLEQYDKAIAEFNEALRLDPKSTDYFLDLGLAYARKGDEYQATEILKRLMPVDRVKAQKLYAEIYKPK